MGEGVGHGRFRRASWMMGEKEKRMGVTKE